MTILIALCKGSFVSTVSIMPTPQLAAAAPVQLCPLCGRRMQRFSTNETTHSYACYQHEQPYYLNLHYKFTNPDGTIKVKE